ncbi:MAG: HRDC domain-containing protein [Micrococcales bacterium]
MTDIAPAEPAATPLPLRAKPNNPAVVLVTDQEGLDAAVAQLSANTGAFALDAERASGFKYSSRAYLVQVQRGNSPIYLIDAPAIAADGELEPFAGLAEVASSDVWILHAATQDLGCLAALGLRPTALFDTELGGRLAGFARVGLGSMTESLLGFRLAKEHSAVDWSQRPMHADWLTYAALDVDVLHELYAAVSGALEASGKAEFARQEFEHLLSFAPKPPKVDRWRGMTGLFEIKDQQKLAVARSLWTARESLAVKMDVSPGRLIPDSSIISVTKTTPRSRSELAGRKDFNGRASRTYLDTWWKAIEDGLNERNLPPPRMPATGIPNHRNWANKFPEAEARLNALKPVVEKCRDELQMPLENVLTPDLMRQLAWEPPQQRTVEAIAEFLKNLGARPWQVEQVSAGFAAAIAGLP